MNWTVADFALAAVLIAAVGGALFLLMRRTGGMAYRIGAGLGLAAAFLLFWVNGAVGIIGAENEDANMLYGVVILAALVGSGLARFRARGMAVSMAVAGVLQLLVPVVALAAIPSAAGHVMEPEVLVATGFFSLLWLGSAIAFRYASQAAAPAQG